MQTLLSLLPALLCPLSMVAMIWLMRRDSTDYNMTDHGVRATPPQQSGIRSFAASLWYWLQCCLNWKVGLGLALIGAGIWAVAPELMAAAVPLLVVLSCPLSMLLMRWGRRQGQQCARTAAPTAAAQGPERLGEGQD